MLHSNVGQTNFIGQTRSFTETFPIGNLEGFMVGKVLPLQEAFQSNVLARIPVGVHFNSAFPAPEQGIIPAFVSVANSTAVVAELGRMPAVYGVKCDSPVETTGCKDFPELPKGHPHNNFVEFLAFGFKPLEILYGNVGIKSQCHVGYSLNHLAKIGINEISLFGSQSLQCREIIGTLHLGPPLHYPLPLNPDIQPKVSLVENFAFIRKNGNGDSLRVEVNSKDILLLGQFNIFFGEICNNILPRSQPIGFACPPVLEKVGIPFKVSILLDRNCNAFSWVNPQLNEEHGFGLKGLAVSGIVELDGIPDSLVLASPDRAFNITYNLDIERGVGLGS